MNSKSTSLSSPSNSSLSQNANANDRGQSQTSKLNLNRPSLKPNSPNPENTSNLPAPMNSQAETIVNATTSDISDLEILPPVATTGFMDSNWSWVNQDTLAQKVEAKDDELPILDEETPKMKEDEVKKLMEEDVEFM